MSAAVVCGMLDFGIVPDAREHRNQSEADEQRDEHRESHGDTELEENSPDDTTHEGDRNEHRNDSKARRHDGETNLVCPFSGRGFVTLSHLEMAYDVFTHPDRIVDEKANREGEREQRQGVHG